MNMNVVAMRDIEIEEEVTIKYGEASVRCRGAKIPYLNLVADVMTDV